MATRNLKVEANIIADTAKYVASIRRAIGETDRFGRSTKKAGKGNLFGNLTRNALRAAAALGGMYAAYDQTKKAITATEELAKGTIQLTRTTGLSTREASRFIAVAKVRGIETTKLATSFTILSKQIVAAQEGSEKASGAFDKLGVSQEAIRKGDTRTVFLNAADGLSKMANNANKTALAAQLFGRGYQALFPLLDMGAKGIQEQLRLAGLLGAELTDKGVASFKEYAAAQRTAQLAMLGLRVQLGTALLPVLSKAAVAVAQFIVNFRTGTGAAGEFRDKLNQAMQAINRIFGPLTGTKSGVANLAAAFATLGSAFATFKIVAALAAIGPAIAAIANPVGLAVAGVAALGAAIFLVYKKSASFRTLVDTVWNALKPTFKSVAKTAQQELPKITKAAGQVYRDMVPLFREMRPIIVAVFKVIAAAAKTAIKGIGPSLNILAGAIRQTTSTVKTMKSVMVGAFGAGKSAAKTFQKIVGGALNGVKAAIDAVAGALRTLRDLLSNLPSAGGALGKLLAKVSKASSLQVARRQDIAAASSFGVGSEVALQEAQRNVSRARGKRAKRAAEARVRQIEAQQAKQQARETLRGFISGILEEIKRTRLEQIMAPVEAARGARAAREFQRNSASISGRITRGTEDLNNPAVRARYERENLRLTNRIAAARRAGNLELVDQLEAEREALEARYTPRYLEDLQDELAQLNENEIERTSEAAAQAFANTFSAGLDQALTALLNGGSVQGFFDRISAVLAGATTGVPSGVTPGSLSAAGITDGVGGAASVVAPSKSWKDRIADWLKNRNKRTYTATEIAQALGTTKANVWKNKPSLKGYPIANRVSGGRLTPGALTLVGETGPEAIVAGRGGMSVMSGTRTARMGAGGMNITINATGAAADNPQLLARELGWQLATR